MAWGKRIVIMTVIKFISALVLTTCLCSLSAVSAAHDFWLEPDKFNAETGQNLSILVKIGHPHDRILWPVNPHRVISLRSVGPHGLQDHQSSLRKIKRSKALPISYDKAGIYIMSIETTAALSELPADQFNSYLDEEGLTPIKLDRLRRGATQTSGTELYSRRGKAIIQIGEPSDVNPVHVTQPIGMTLEIVPMQNPATLQAGEKMTSKVYYRGEAVSGISVGLVDLLGEDGGVATAISNNEGVVAFDRPVAGTWMQHAVWADAMEDTSRADYDTVFSSLSFSIP